MRQIRDARREARRSGGSSWRQIDDARGNGSIAERQVRDAHRKPESTRPRAARIDVQHRTVLPDDGAMRVTRHDNADRREVGFELRKIVQNVDRGAVDAKALHVRDRLHPRAAIVVAAYDWNL